MPSNVVLSGKYDHRLVVLSILVAICSSYAALDLARQLYKRRGIRKLLWLAGGSIAMGVGIWAMHYIGMEAYRLPIAVAYDWPTVLLSIFAAVGASAVALYEVSRPVRSFSSDLTGGVSMGLGISAMHYIGMRAMRLDAMHVYSLGLFVISIVVAIGISFVALDLASASRESVQHVSWRKICSALLLGLAIASMHYIGMAAVSFTPIASANASVAHAIGISKLGFAGICATVLVLFLTVVVLSIFSRQHDVHAGQLAANQSQLQAIFDSLRESVCVFDRDHNLIRFNRSASDLIGLKKDDSSKESLVRRLEITLPSGELLAPEYWPSVAALRGEFVRDLSLKIYRKDTGDTFDLNISSSPIYNHAGEIVQVVVSYHNVTQTNASEEARKRLASIVESSEDAIIGKNVDGVVTSWNIGAERMFGYTAAQMIGQSVRRLLPDDRLEEEDDILARITRGETVDHIETVRKKKNGQFIHASLTVTPIRDSSGRVVGASKIVRNITDRKKLENQLQQSRKMEAIGLLTGGIAHDFNNLLGVVIGSLDLLERQIQGNPAALKRVDTARGASLRGADLTRRLLAFSRQQDLQPAAIDLDAAIENVLALAASTLGPDIQVVTKLDSSIPKVFADAPGLESALLNLVVNARDSMPTGGKLTITSDVRNVTSDEPFGQASDLKPGPYVCVSVSDTGHGMPPEVVRRAFDPFFTTKPKGKGTGLGLAMVYGYFNQSGGTVLIYSEIGYGTTVSFYLPLTFEAPEAALVPSVEERSSIEIATILVVDDEPDLLEIASTTLGELGYTVHTAKDGADALKIFEMHKEIDLLLTDIIMPGGMTGVELARKAVAINSRLEVIFCSGFPADALAERLEPSTEGPLLRKPYQRAELLAMVRTVLAARRGTKDTRRPLETVSTQPE